MRMQNQLSILYTDSDEPPWYFRMLREIELVYKAFKSYIHPEGDFQNGYADICNHTKSEPLIMVT